MGGTVVGASVGGIAIYEVFVMAVLLDCKL